MGNTKASASQAPKKRKKGRPSLLDLQKRTLRLEKLEHDAKPRNPTLSPAPNPYARAPTPARRSIRRNPAAAEPSVSDDDDDETEGSSGRPKRKKLSFVLRVNSADRRDGPDSPTASGSDSDARRKRRIDSVGADEDRRKAERQNRTSKATDLPQELSESGPTTPLPDKKLLVFILDRLQKKDTYGVFSEPVDPTELPDYHDIIEHPMDFGTIRKKLASGDYGNLEQFENDVFLISSNAMRYNSPDTIYFRQARAIQELAKKNFENLRQESDDNEPEPKPARRGRPPSKNIVKTVGRPPAERAGSDFSSSTFANADNARWSNLSHDLSQKGPDKSSEASTRPYGLRNLETHSWRELKTDRNENIAGSTMKVIGTKYGKKPSVADENRRITYKQAQVSCSANESSVLMAFDGERKQLLSVGLQMDYAYARSLARFAANLGPVGWEIAAKRIEKVLPPGMNFGRGWVGENDMPQQSLQVILNRSANLSTAEKVSSDAGVAAEQPSNDSVVGVSSTIIPPAASSSTLPNMKPAEFARNEEGGLKSQSCNMGHGIWPKTSFQLQENTSMQSTLNDFNQLSQLGRTILPLRPPENFCSEMAMTHSRALDMVSRGKSSYTSYAHMNNSNTEKVNLADISACSYSGNNLHDSGHGVQGQWRGLSLTKQVSAHPDLNVGLQSPRSPASGMLVDSQHANLSLQL